MPHSAAMLLLLPLLLPVTSGFNLLATRPASLASAAAARSACRTASPRLSTAETRAAAFAAWLETHIGTMGSPTVSRRKLLRGAVWATGVHCVTGMVASASAYTVDKVKPNEAETYAVAQKGKGPLRILWVGSGTMTRQVSKNLFLSGNTVTALDLVPPDATDLAAATTYATEHGYRLHFEQGDATKLQFADQTFDVVVCSFFLCQDFDPEVVVSEIRRVLKPGGRFGFFEHVDNIDRVIVGKVFGARSVIQVQELPENLNVMAGVVRKV